MKTTSTIVSSLLLSLAAAVPLRQRDLVYETVTSDVFATVSTTTTVWLNDAVTSYAPMVTVTAGASDAAPSSPAPTTEAAASSSPAASAPASSAPAPAPVASSAASSSSAAVTPEAVTSTASSSATSSAPSSTPSSTLATSTTVQSSSTSSAAQTSSTSSSGSGSNSGDMTYYQPGLGACGWESSDSDAIVALSVSLMGSLSSGDVQNSYCGKTITIHHGSSTTQAKVVDKCQACAEHDIDVSSSVFSDIADMNDGRVEVTWSFN